MATAHFTDEGHKQMLQVYFQNVTAPSDFLVALYNDTATGTDDEPGDLSNEQTGTGYSQITINRDATASGWPTGPALDSSEMMITSKACTFTAGAADWIAFQCIALIANLATDKLVAYINTGSINLGNADTVTVTWKLKLTKV